MPQWSPTFIAAQPDLLKVIAELEFENLRFVRTGSSALPDSMYHYLKRRFGVPVIEAYGMTEALSHCFTNPLHGEQRIGTIGLPDGIEADIQDQHLLIKGPTVFYSGWYDTGDLAEQDSAGYYKILGRSVDQINVKGYKINPASVETQLKQLCPNIGELVIFGHTACNVIYTGDADPGLVSQHLISIHPACRPRMIKQLPEIPTFGQSKISRKNLIKNFDCK